MFRILCFVALASLFACHTARPLTRTTSPAASEATASADTRTYEKLYSVLWTQTSAEFKASSIQTYRLAERQLVAALADETWSAALEQNLTQSDLAPSVVVDVDETILDNSPFQARLIASDSGFSVSEFEKWVNEERAEAIPGALEFLSKANSLGVTVFFVTNRSAEMEPATLRNLKSLGLATDADHILSKGEVGKDGKIWASDKSARRSQIAVDHRILLLVGDDLNDFVTGARGASATPASRAALAATHREKWGSRWILIPNAVYGGWELSLVSWDYALPRAQALAKMYAQLSTHADGDETPWTDPLTGMTFHVIPGGEFAMGSTYYPDQTDDQDRYGDESPVHAVRLGAFAISNREVTVAQFRQFVSATGHVTDAEKRGTSLGEYSETEPKRGHWIDGAGLSWKNPGFANRDDYPVVHVSWYDAVAFCDWMSNRDAGAYYTLPSEAEWEYAAGAGKFTYSWGNDPPTIPDGGNVADARFSERYPGWQYPVLAEYDDGFVHLAPVGSYSPNDLGLYDMTGNAYEWTNDYYARKYYEASPKVNPGGPPSGESRSMRGGGFDWEDSYLRVAKREFRPPDASMNSLGFRVAQRITLPPRLHRTPRRVEIPGPIPKVIEEVIGRSTGDGEVSLALVQSPPGWTQAGATPEFTEHMLVTKGVLRVEFRGGKIDVAAGEALTAPAGAWVRYSTPTAEGADYFAVAVPAFDISLLHPDAE